MDGFTKLTNATSCCAFVKGIFMAFLTVLPVACTVFDGDVYEAQADIYKEYKSKIDTASSYSSLKDLNDRLEKELVTFIKDNGRKMVEGNKSKSNNSSGEKALAKAESDYTRAYLNKFMTIVIKEQISLYAEYLSKISGASSYEELYSLDNSLNSALTEINSKSSSELKMAKAKNIVPEQFNALDKAQAEYLSAYANKMVPHAYEKEKDIYEKYLLKLDAAEGYARIKELRLYMANELAMFNNGNAKVFQSVAQGNYAVERAAVVEAKDNFEKFYMNKASFAVLEYQKQIYSGAVEVLAAVKSADELDRVNRAFLDVNDKFQKSNAEELQWIVNAATGSNVYKKAMDEVNASLDKVYKAADKKAAELGLM